MRRHLLTPASLHRVTSGQLLLRLSKHQAQGVSKAAPTLCRFKSTLHRVVSTSGKPRLSCACFFDPDFDTVRFGLF